MLDRSPVFFERERVAITAQLRPPLHWQGDQQLSVYVTVSLLTQGPEGMCCSAKFVVREIAEGER